jgi:hypothetical protein
MSRRLALLAILATCAVACSQQNPQAGASTSAPAQTAAADAQAAPPVATASPQANEPGTASARSAAAPEPAAAPKPASPPQPRFQEVTIPAGTSLAVTLLSNLASNNSQVEDPVKGSIANPVVVGGTTVIPEGTPISGSVTAVAESGRVKGRASIGLRFDRLTLGSEAHKIQTAAVTREAAADTKSDVKKGAVGTGLGAVVGGVAGGGTGAAIGAVAGGVGTVLATKGSEVELPAGTALTVLLQEPLVVTVPVK